MTSKASRFPELGDVVFSLKTFIAAMLALAIALCFDLQNPYWAVGTVYIVSHPLSGASTSKAVYRLLGTAIGGTMTVILLPNLVNSPEVLTLAISLWMGLCLAVALLDRTPRSYVFMLAGYTTALTAFPIVATPEIAFTYAAARVIEIAVAIVCAAVVSRVFLPRHAGPVLATRIDAWLKDGAALALGTLRGRYSDPANTALVGRLSADAVDLHAFTTHVSYDTSSHRDMVDCARALQRRMIVLLPVTSGLADVLATLSRVTTYTPAMTRLIDAVSDWLESGQPLSPDQRQTFLTLMEEAENDTDGRPPWAQLLVQNVVARMRDLIQIWSDCIDLKSDIASGSRHALRWNRFGASLDTQPMHKDYGMAIYSALVAMLSTCIATAAWILTGWPQGSTAAMMAGVICCLFAAMDDPTPAIRGFITASLAAVVAAFVLEFGIFPMVYSYWALSAALGLFLIPAGVLMAKPKTMLLGLGFGVNLPNMLSLQGRLSLDLQTFLNSNTALIIGLVIACCTTALVRSVGAEWSARRLLQAGWADIAAATRRQKDGDVTGLLHRMVDRLGLAAPRLASLPASAALTPNDVLKDLRNGLNTVDLQRLKSSLSATDSAAVDAVLVSVADHYRAKRDAADDPSGNLLATLDRSLAILGADAISTEAAGARRAMTGLRYNLFPDAPIFAANENRAAPDMTAAEKAA
ncbi:MULTISPECIES: FUSC family protein [Rhizobium]|uniref:FUSC family protein n=1 Tax=Rhizobium rhododendri TaxID=2506430 RepID=A0ABY8IGZ9_9HYPH|nr:MULTISPECIES: FUSC family protein [Rhizobium]MBZ5803696.1 FUSC family protein [Rhizobium sp. VS19-DR181]MBZ5832001.1 FUSC family protein [Rhizobium sp. VS19-DR104.2]QXZ79197.1 FUSC family protein [Rhizobium sp. L51/94]TQX86540.1 FUSC family protein [Rhizobium sp. rho-13.1]TQY12264.1 FUSC family protein [Rhizobium sp. rho-1.1]